MTPRRTLIPLVVAASLGAAQRAEATTSEQLASRVATFDVHRGVIAWVRRDLSRRSQLYVRRNGVTRAVSGGRTAADSNPIAVDVGPDGRGGIRIVLSGCFARCGLHEIVGSPPRMRKLRQGTSAAAFPSVWGDRLAFIERGQIRIGSVTGRVSAVGPVGEPGDSTGPERVQFGPDGRIAFSWLGSLGSCSVPDDGDRQAIRVYVSDPAGAPRQVAGICPADELPERELVGWLGRRLLLIEASDRGGASLVEADRFGRLLRKRASVSDGAVDLSADAKFTYYVNRADRNTLIRRRDR